MNKFVIINDELRLGDVNDFKELTDEEAQNIKCKGHWKIDRGDKQIFFYGNLKPIDLYIIMGIKKCGFYTPMIQGYRWMFSDQSNPKDYIEI